MNMPAVLSAKKNKNVQVQNCVLIKIEMFLVLHIRVATPIQKN